MPIYIFQHPSSKEVREIVQRVNESHTFEENGVKWNRIFTIPNASIDTKINPHSQKDFTDKTSKKNYTIGDMWDKSAEMSEKRARVLGNDPIKEKAKSDYSKRTKKPHPQAKGP
jgi:hypothetical protein